MSVRFPASKTVGPSDFACSSCLGTQKRAIILYVFVCAIECVYVCVCVFVSKFELTVVSVRIVSVCLCA